MSPPYYADMSASEYTQRSSPQLESPCPSSCPLVRVPAVLQQTTAVAEGSPQEFTDSLRVYSEAGQSLHSIAAYPSERETSTTQIDGGLSKRFPPLVEATVNRKLKGAKNVEAVCPLKK